MKISRSRFCLLLTVGILLNPGPPCSAAETESFSGRLKKALQELNAREFDAAIAALKALREDFPDKEVCDYNLACAYALWEKKELALKNLASAVEKGYDDVLWMRADPDLESLREEKAYKDIERQARKVFLDSIEYYVQKPTNYDPKKKYGLLVFMVSTLTVFEGDTPPS